MKKAIVTIAVAVLAAVVLADVGGAHKKGRPRGAKPSGGIVEKKYSANTLKVVDAQGGISHEKLAGIVQDARWSALLPFDTVSGNDGMGFEALIAFAKETASGEKVGAVVVVVDNAKIPLRIYSEESNWAILNLAFLHDGNPSEALFEERVEKMLWRALARSLQVGSVAKSPSVLQPFKTLAELDANKFMRPSPEGYNAFIDNAKAYGIETITIASYRDACHKGWAPAPTNDVQKAIWEEVRQLPAKPITIEFDPKRGK